MLKEQGQNVSQEEGVQVFKYRLITLEMASDGLEPIFKKLIDCFNACFYNVMHNKLSKESLIVFITLLSLFEAHCERFFNDLFDLLVFGLASSSKLYLEGLIECALDESHELSLSACIFQQIFKKDLLRIRE
jgi:hypothetical protein